MKKLGRICFAIVAITGFSVSCTHLSQLDRGIASLPSMNFSSTAVPERINTISPVSAEGQSAGAACSSCAH